MTSGIGKLTKLGSVGKRLVGGVLLSVAGVLGLPAIASAAICPTTGSTNTDCGFVLTIGPGNAITGQAVSGANPYDGSDDALVGIINNSGATFTGSFTLSGSGNGGGIFGFDDDGACTYIAGGCSFPNPSTYEGPLVTFSNISADTTSGTVNVTGLLAGATTWFSLEGSPASISAGGGVGIPSAVPEPETWALMMVGLAGLGFVSRRRKIS